MVLLIGLATVLAAVFGWRAAAIGSTAAFDDRQSISETIKVEQEQIGIGIAVAGDAREYNRYLGDYAVAAELDNQAAALAAAGNGTIAAGNRREAEDLRRTATRRAADAGVFGPFSIQDDLRAPAATPRPFDIDERATAREAALVSSFDSPGTLDPDGWAASSEAIRDRMVGLAGWSLVLLTAVLFFTVGQVNSDRRPVFYVFMAAGLVALLVGGVGGFTTDFTA